MNHLGEYEKRVLALMNPPKTAESNDDLVVGFDFGSIFAMILPILLEMVGGCLGPKTPEQIATKLTERGVVVRASAQRAVNQACNSCGTRLSAFERQRLARATLDGLGTKHEATAVLAELRSESEWGV